MQNNHNKYDSSEQPNRDPEWAKRYEKKRKERSRAGIGLITILLYLVLLTGLAFAISQVLLALVF